VPLVLIKLLSSMIDGILVLIILGGPGARRRSAEVRVPAEGAETPQAPHAWPGTEHGLAGSGCLALHLLRTDRRQAGNAGTVAP
jgi:hypothetical protein